MATKNRLYAVKSKDTGTTRLVEANTPMRAMMHVAKNLHEVSIPAQHEVYALAKAGVEVELANDQETVTDETRTAVSQSTIE